MNSAKKQTPFVEVRVFDEVDGETVSVADVF